MNRRIKQTNVGFIYRDMPATIKLTEAETQWDLATHIPNVPLWNLGASATFMEKAMIN